ncbi:MAG TPA: aminotransferase class III-fold pyridoxal phosphate-dependent enzyme, partial [Fusobacterium sp.]|uniref:aminotransferase class III-fold pyridoxal phosphate-dependent enzyme n=1 Tax=Fusobacterium sp. TaxID=68766 RepID=UPI002F41277B
QERVGRKIAALALEKGVLIRPIGNIVYFMPPYIITKEEIDSMLEVCKVSIEEYIEQIKK